jgi:Serine dehydrogenase proteinase
VDPQLSKFPAGSGLKVIAKKPVKDDEDETLIMADQAEKAIFQVRESVKELLHGNSSKGKADYLRESQGTRASRQFQYTRRRLEAHEPLSATHARAADSGVPSRPAQPQARALNTVIKRSPSPELGGQHFWDFPFFRPKSRKFESCLIGFS